MTPRMRYYLVDTKGKISTIIAEDARQEFLAKGERLRTRESNKEVINNTVFVRAFGVIV